MHNNSIINLPLALHIGYHKTATTYLQHYVFNNHPEIYYLGMPFINKEITDFFIRYKFTHDLNLDHGLLRKSFENILQKISYKYENEKRSLKIVLISKEGLHNGSEWFGMEVVNRAKRLSKVFPSAKIIIGIRNQVDYIESNYKQYIKQGGKLSFKNFLYNSFACNYCLLPKLEYDKIISLYKNLFGDNAVYVYLQEDLKLNLREAVARLMTFLNVRSDIVFKQAAPNPGLSSLSINFIRTINKLLAYDFNEQYYQLRRLSEVTSKEFIRNKIVGLIKKIEGDVFKNFNSKKRLAKKYEIQYIRDYFHDSNERLSKLLNRNIADLGYF